MPSKSSVQVKGSKGTTKKLTEGSTTFSHKIALSYVYLNANESNIRFGRWASATGFHRDQFVMEAGASISIIRKGARAVDLVLFEPTVHVYMLPSGGVTGLVLFVGDAQVEDIDIHTIAQSCDDRPPKNYDKPGVQLSVNFENITHAQLRVTSSWSRC